MNLELSIVIPCLNESDTLAECIDKALKVIEDNNLSAEIIIADNGSTDNSVEIAKLKNVRVINVSQKGYGWALRGGMDAAEGKFIIMGDADNSYDFSDLMKFVIKLRDGNDMVMGSRFPSGGGEIKKGAMPFLHQYFGNPFFALLARFMFKAQIHDPYCGFRGFTKDLYSQLQLKCTGMEFAIELILKSVIFNKKIAEVPIILYPDGRTAHAPHLKTFRDGWRTLRFFLLLSPFHILFVPGSLLVAISFIMGNILYFHPIVEKSFFYSIDLFLYNSIFFLVGVQILIFWIFAKTFSSVEGLQPRSIYMDKFYNLITIEKGAFVSIVFLVIGVVLGVQSFEPMLGRVANSFQYLNSLKVSILASTSVSLAVQILFASLLISSIGLNRK